jgi:hypothetical protein
MGSEFMARPGSSDSTLQVTRGKRIGLGILGLVIVFLMAGPPDFAAAMVVTGWSSDLDGGAHQFHIFMRGVGAAVSTALGVVLILRPQWAIGVAQVAIAMGISYPVAGLLGLFAWPPVFIYPVVGLIIAGVVYAMFRNQLPGRANGFVASPSRMLLIATAVVAVPLIGFGLSEASLQRGPELLHGELGHWAGGTALVVKVILMGLFASMKWPGWRVPAWSVAFTLVMFGIGSVFMPNQASSVGEMWGALAILGGVAYIGVAELEGRLYPRASVQPAA